MHFKTKKINHVYMGGKTHSKYCLENLGDRGSVPYRGRNYLIATTSR